MILTTLALTTLGAALANALGRSTGFEQGVKQVFKDLDDGGSCHAYGHVAVGTTMPASDWGISGGSIQVGYMDKPTPDEAALPSPSLPSPHIEATMGEELCPSGWPAIRPVRIDPIDVEHARKVLVKGYEHPFLNTRSIG